MEQGSGLSKYMHHLQPAPGYWRLLPMEVPVCTGAWKWLRDSQDTKGAIHLLTISYFPLMVTTVQCQTGLAECNTSCDDTGNLILQPRPHVQ
ncbi:unnamed protein product [Nyctereutes procyonoides]|uniref:(raccoon dog) hypothetical protein n=1 Tax=Nyctereutes procyonoides TaxID=34880 RepID=A0A811ZK43_NYCPR|nr:unnamed protein product [Nyctereutes procyonoides]